MKLFLVGYMGCGKSTTGRRVARRLGVAYVDTDAMIEQREGASVTDIFHYEGEEYFREAERKVLAEVIEKEDTYRSLCTLICQYEPFGAHQSL